MIECGTEFPVITCMKDPNKGNTTSTIIINQLHVYQRYIAEATDRSDKVYSFLMVDNLIPKVLNEKDVVRDH